MSSASTRRRLRLLLASGLVPVLAACAPQPSAGDAAVQASVKAATAAPAPAPTDAIPTARLKLPPGFAIDVWASDVRNARSLAQSETGTIFVGSREGDSVTALRDDDGDGKAERRQVVASHLKSPNGVAVKDGALYVAEISRILRFDGIDHLFDDPTQLKPPVVVTDDYPTDGWHGWKFIAFGPDGMLYVPVGAPCNVCDPDEPFASITRIRPDGTGREIYSRGIRNSVGFTWHPVTNELWFTDNGADEMGDDLPSCELNRASAAGQHFGYPYCHQGDVLDPKFGKGRSCDSFVPPAWKMGPHVAPLGVRFYTGTMFPEKYRNAALVAEHGSWNRSKKIGYRVVALFLDASGTKVLSEEPLIEGFLGADESVSGRPVDVLVLKDGSLLVSDDHAGAVYRVTWKAS